ncbi:hypothetical protein [Geothrix oryzisoli]|uniref:hypothetical protein n=1 Tax=Geothrix oryzisoli TaxID=2922721 RepID=UPI001FACAD2D|nr:hypothetical protein [Geothrix oryzisoli]
MASTLRDLLIQRAARLQGRPALTAPEWGTLGYGQLRNRAEGVALGLLAAPPPPSVFSATGTAWDWAAELAAAAAGLTWGPGGQRVPMEVLGGPRFNAEAGRGAYHAREQVVTGAIPFSAGLTQGELMLRLRRLNAVLGWDHDTRVELPLPRLGEPALRAALWSALYAGAHAVLVTETAPATGLLARFRQAPPLAWNPDPFLDVWR